MDSFSGGVLTIKLNDGSMVSGKVTDATEMECTSSSTTSGDDNDDNGDDQSGDQSGGDHGVSGDRSISDDNGDQGDDNGDRGDDNGDQSSACSSTALAPGTVVRSAELKVSNAGAVWDKLELGSQ